MYTNYLQLSFRLPFQKIITLLIRTMAKPMLTMAKKKHQQKKATYFNTFFIFFGRKYHRAQNWINMKIIKTTKDKHIKELKEEVALEKGIEGIYQIFFYMIVIGLPLHEMYKASISTQAKQEKLNNQIEGLQSNIDKISRQLDQLTVKKIQKYPLLNLTLPQIPQLKPIQQINKQQKLNAKSSQSQQNSSKSDEQKNQNSLDLNHQYAESSEASEIVAETVKDQIQDSILEALSDFIEEAVMDVIQSV